MREILFRGKHDKKYDKNQNWVYGVPYFDYDKDCIMATDNTKSVVIPETVGQYTGLTDKNGKKIFEGDICSFTDFHSGSDMETYCTDIWSFEDAQFCISDRLFCYTWDLICEGVFDGFVIGNIHDNPELLEVTE